MRRWFVPTLLIAAVLGLLIARGPIVLVVLFAIGLVAAVTWLGWAIARLLRGRGEAIALIAFWIVVATGVAFRPVHDAVDNSSVEDDDVSGLIAAATVVWFAFWFEVGLIGGWLQGRWRKRRFDRSGRAPTGTNP